MDHKNLETWYRGTVCHAPGLVVPEKKTEIPVSSDSSVDTEDKPDWRGAYWRLEHIKRHMLKLRGQIVAPAETSSSSEPPPRNVTPENANSLHFLQLKRNNIKMEEKLKVITKKIESTCAELKEQDIIHCQLTERIKAMQKDQEIFERFKQTVIDHFGICIERNEQLKAIKVEEHEFGRNVREMRKHVDAKRLHLVSMKCHQQLKLKISKELISMHNFLQAAFSSINFAWNPGKCQFKLLKSPCLKPILSNSSRGKSKVKSKDKSKGKSKEISQK